MEERLYETIGRKLRVYRKRRQLTLKDLSAALNKSLATVAKYEKGEISADLETLVRWCRYLNADIADLLPATSVPEENADLMRYEKHFIDRLYLYWYKGEEKKIHSHVIENDNLSMKSRFYFNIKSLDNIYDSEYVYEGHVTYTDASTYFTYYNIAPPFDLLTFSMPFLTREQSYKTGMISTITFYYQPVAIKTLASKVPITDEDFLAEKLQISAQEIKDMKYTNFFIP